MNARVSSFGWNRRGDTEASIQYVINIDSARHGVTSALRELWTARRLLAYFVRRDFKTRYRATFLGSWWILLRPIAELLPYIIVFGIFLKLKPGPLPYAVFLVAGFAPWLFLGGFVGASPNAMAKTRSLINKIYFPRLIVPLNDLITRLADYIVTLGAAALLALAYGISPAPQIWALPILTILLVAMTFGAGLVVTTVCTLRPDLAFGVPAATRFLFYGSAIIYPLDIVPEPYRSWFIINPVATIIGAIRWSLFGFDGPSLPAMLIASISSVLVLGIGLHMFLRLERRLADVL